MSARPAQGDAEEAVVADEDKENATKDAEDVVTEDPKEDRTTRTTIMTGLHPQSVSEGRLVIYRKTVCRRTETTAEDAKETIQAAKNNRREPMTRKMTMMTTKEPTP